MASLSAALPLSSATVMVERARLALVRSPSAALFRVPRTPEAVEATMLGGRSDGGGRLGWTSTAAPPSRP